MTSLAVKTNLLLFFMLLSGWAAAQMPAKSGRFSVKVGVSTGFQMFENIPAYKTNVVSDDTLWRSKSGSYNAAGFSVMAYYETRLSARLAVIGGLGFRRKGFSSSGKYNPRTGVIDPIADDVFESNRMDFVTADFGLKLMLTKNTKWVPYVLAMNRLGALVGMKTPFWSTASGKYGGYRQFEYSLAFAGGVEVPLRTVVLGKKSENAVARPYSRLLFEFEYNPGVSNIHKDSERYLTRTPLQVRSPGFSYPLPVDISRKAYNESFSFTAGLMF